MAKLNECTHTYLGTPVKIMTEYLYTMAPGYVEIYDPNMGQRQIVQMKDLKPLTKANMAVVQVDVNSEPTKKTEKKSTKKTEKKTEKKDDKKDDKKEKEDKKRKEKEDKAKKEAKEAKEKEDKKKKLKKEDVTSKIDSFLEEEGWFGDKAKQLKLEVNKAYEGMLEFIRDFKSMAHGTINKGAKFFAKKEAGKSTVTLTARKDSALTNTNNIKTFNINQINDYINLLGMRGLANVYGKPAYESVENKISTFLEEKE